LNFFCQKNIGSKAACKMLMKLTTGVSFTYILQAALSNQRVLSSFSLFTVCASTFIGKEFWRKSWSKEVGKVDYRYLIQILFIGN